jgi:hypothetical protein
MAGQPSGDGRHCSVGPPAAVDPLAADATVATLIGPSTNRLRTVLDGLHRRRLHVTGSQSHPDISDSSVSGPNGQREPLTNRRLPALDALRWAAVPLHDPGRRRAHTGDQPPRKSMANRPLTQQRLPSRVPNRRAGGRVSRLWSLKLRQVEGQHAPKRIVACMDADRLHGRTSVFATGQKLRNLKRSAE